MLSREKEPFGRGVFCSCGAAAADPLVSISPTNHRETEATLMVILCHDVAVNCARLNEVFDLKQKAFSHARAVFSHLASSLA